MSFIEKGIANGVASLDASGQVPASQLLNAPSGVSRTNFVLVKTKADFPAPVGGVITLADNTAYEINGTIILGTDRIVTGISNIIYGVDKSDDVLVYTGTASAMITSTNQDLTLSKITLVSSGATSEVFNLSGSGTNRVEIAESIFANSVSVGSVTGGFDTVVFRNNLVVGNADGIVISGTNNDLFITDNLFEGFTGTPTFLEILAPATYHTIIISRNMFEIATGQRGIYIDPNLIVSDGGLIISNAFEDDGTYLDGINASSLGWQIPSNTNVGIAGLLKIAPFEIQGATPLTTTDNITFIGSSTASMFTTFSYTDYQDSATELDAFFNAEVTHDQTNQIVVASLYDNTAGNFLSFGHSSGVADTGGKLDIDTITWQSGTIVRATFNGTPSLTQAVVGDFITIESATNASNNGQFIITAVNDGADWIEYNNAARTDATDDEATNSPATAYGGGVVYVTVTTGGVYQPISFPKTNLPANSDIRVAIKRGSSTGANPSVALRNGIIKSRNY